MSSQIFSLSDKFLSQYQGKQPNWGYGDLSLIVYKRTYSRLKEDGTKEEFFDTVKRVVEGCFQLQLDHCIKSGLPWEAAKAQRSAQKMFEKIWQFKFLPPGRGLWLMGAPIIKKIFSAGLNNCGYISTKFLKKSLSEPFAWACDMLMLGVGIGFDTLGAGSVTIQEPLGEAITIVIEDSREGWVNSIRSLIDSYTGKQPVHFDYSLIRPAGTLIKGFGGTASGPQVLIDGHITIRNLLHSLINKPITSVAITDIMNMIGKFVVAGNTRRSAQIALSTSDDTDFISMKDPDLHLSELLSHRWASNNSVFYTPGDDLTHIIPKISKNGEPGIVLLQNARHYGRFKDGYHPESSPKFDNCDGPNPCLPASSLFLTLTRGIVKLSDLSIGETVWTGESWASVTNIWSTGIKPVYRYKTSKGFTIDCTEDHKLVTTTGKIEARHAVDVLITPPTTPIEGGIRFEDHAKILSSEFIGDMEVFDFTVDAPEHSAWVNGVIISNCAEQFLTHGELCCLAELFPANHDSADDFLDTVKYAYLYAKSVTLLPTHSTLTNSVMLRNRRIGLSQSGIQQAIKKFGYQSYFNQFCNESYNRVQHWDMIYSRWLGIPQSIKTTTVKPAGTTSLLSGATPGVHCTHSEFYLRTIRIAASDALIPELERAGYRIEIAVTDNKKVQGLLKSPYHLDIDTIPVAWDEITPYEKDLIKKESITLVVYFPVQEANFTKSKYDISLWEQMMLVKELQHVWSDNAVSCTITFKPEEAKDLESAINYFSRYTKSLSFLPLTDHNYAQAPYQTIDKTEYDEYVSRLKPLNSSNSSSEIAGAKYCDAEGCTI